VTNCHHKNPLGFAFCVTCGESITTSRCPRCGFACDQRFIFCGGCGRELQALNSGAEIMSAMPAPMQTRVRRYDLAALMVEYELEAASKGSNGKVNQDDIRAMLEMMQKK